MKINKCFLEIALFLISLFLVSCAPLTSTPSPVSTTAIPTVSPAPAETAVSPTKVTVPSNWVETGSGLYVSPDVIKLQEQVAATKDYTLVPDGNGMVLETKLPDGTTMKIPGFVQNPDGTMVLTIDGQTVSATSLTFDKDGKPQWISSDGSTYSFDGTKIAKEVVKFSFSSDKVLFLEALKHKDTLDSFVPPEALLDGSDAKFLKTLSWPNFGTNLKILKPIRFNISVPSGSYDVIRFSALTAPNYPNPETNPIQRSFFQYTVDRGAEYLVVPARYFVKGVDPKDYPVIPGLIYVGPVDSSLTPNNEQWLLDTYLEDTNYPVLVASDLIYPDPSAGLAPFPFQLLASVWEKYPDIQSRIDSYVATGDPSKLDGIPLRVLAENDGKYNK